MGTQGKVVVVLLSGGLDFATLLAIAQIIMHTPLIRMSYAEIIRAGLELGVDYSRTVSCYPTEQAGRVCGLCDSCRIRQDGFSVAGVADPTRYR